MLGNNRVEIEDSDSDHVVMSIVALRLIVLGRMLSEAQALAMAALAFRGQEGGRRTELARSAQDSRRVALCRSLLGRRRRPSRQSRPRRRGVTRSGSACRSRSSPSVRQ